MIGHYRSNEFTNINTSHGFAAPQGAGAVQKQGEAAAQALSGVIPGAEHTSVECKSDYDC
jgi:hypothetical protein